MIKNSDENSYKLIPLHILFKQLHHNFEEHKHAFNSLIYPCRDEEDHDHSVFNMLKAYSFHHSEKKCKIHSSNSTLYRLYENGYD